MVQVRDETVSDLLAIHEVHAAAFPTPGEAQLVDRLRADGDLVISLVAAFAHEIVGHVALSRMHAPFRALGLAPVAVRLDLQNKGLGSTLIRTGLARAKAESWGGVFVLGDTAYYERFGFRADLAAGFSCHYAGPHFMALAFSATLPQSDGDVAYARAFDALE